MAALQEYKCPCCGGALEFNTGVQKMKCPFCDSEFEMEALQSYDEELQNEGTDDFTWETTAGSEWTEGETESMRSYVCKSCGGEIIGDANTAATACPYCGNPIVMMGQFSGTLKPDFVIPFKLDKEAAKAEGYFTPEAYEIVKKLVLAWDPDFTKVTPKEARELAEAEASGFLSEEEIDWDHLDEMKL